MKPLRLGILTFVTLTAFAANSLLARAALASGQMGAAEFSLIRLFSGALMLTGLVILNPDTSKSHAPPQLSAKFSYIWGGAAALCLYAVMFSFAYLELDTGTGALCLFAAVQLTIIGHAAWKNELSRRDIIGSLIAFAGFLVLIGPSIGTPSARGFILMTISGIAWGLYTLLGRKAQKPLLHSQKNFIKATILALPLMFLMFPQPHISTPGTLLAITSGALASGVGYAIWYSVLPHLKSSLAASLQLLVPILAAFMGRLFLDEVLSLRFWICLLYTSPSPRDRQKSRMPSSA